MSENKAEKKTGALSYVFYKSEEADKWHRSEKCAKDNFREDHDILAIVGGADVDPDDLKMCRGRDIEDKSALCGNCVKEYTKQAL